MKYLLGFFALTFLGTSLLAQDDEIDDSQDRVKVEAAVVKWADSVFYSHSNYKFENFRAEYSEGYFIAVMRARAYKERVTEFEQDKAAGRYKGTQEAYTSEHKTLTDAHNKAQTEADTYKDRADYYLVHFWTNIQTTDGITVYYEHIVKLNNSYQVTEATINSAIGKKDENTQVLYRKDVKGGIEKKAPENIQPEEMQSADTDSKIEITPSDSKINEDSVNTADTPVETTSTSSSGKKKKEKKKKK